VCQILNKNENAGDEATAEAEAGDDAAEISPRTSSASAAVPAPAPAPAAVPDAVERSSEDDLRVLRRRHKAPPSEPAPIAAPLPVPAPAPVPVQIPTRSPAPVEPPAEAAAKARVEAKPIEYKGKVSVPSSSRSRLSVGGKLPDSSGGSNMRVSPITLNENIAAPANIAAPGVVGTNINPRGVRSAAPSTSSVPVKAESKADNAPPPPRIGAFPDVSGGGGLAVAGTAAKATSSSSGASGSSRQSLSGKMSRFQQQQQLVQLQKEQEKRSQQIKQLEQLANNIDEDADEDQFVAEEEDMKLGLSMRRDDKEEAAVVKDDVIEEDDFNVAAAVGRMSIQDNARPATSASASDRRPSTSTPAPIIEDMPIGVVVRKRPISKSELARGDYDVLEIQHGGCVLVHEPKTRVSLSYSLKNLFYSLCVGGSHQNY
jgi:hypothetical protein